MKKRPISTYLFTIFIISLIINPILAESYDKNKYIKLIDPSSIDDTVRNWDDLDADTKISIYYENSKKDLTRLFNKLGPSQIYQNEFIADLIRDPSDRKYWSAILDTNDPKKGLKVLAKMGYSVVGEYNNWNSLNPVPNVLKGWVWGREEGKPLLKYGEDDRYGVFMNKNGKEINGFGINPTNGQSYSSIFGYRTGDGPYDFTMIEYEPFPLYLIDDPPQVWTRDGQLNDPIVNEDPIYDILKESDEDGPSDPPIKPHEISRANNMENSRYSQDSFNKPWGITKKLSEIFPSAPESFVSNSIGSSALSTSSDGFWNLGLYKGMQFIIGEEEKQVKLAQNNPLKITSLNMDNRGNFKANNLRISTNYANIQTPSGIITDLVLRPTNGEKSTSDQHVNIIGQNIDMSGERIIVDIKQPFNINAKGENLKVFNGEMEFIFKGKETYYSRRIENIPFEIAEISNGLNNKHIFKLTTSPDNKGILTDYNGIISIGDLTTDHPRNNLIDRQINNIYQTS